MNYNGYIQQRNKIINDIKTEDHPTWVSIYTWQLKGLKPTYPINELGRLFGILFRKMRLIK